MASLSRAGCWYLFDYGMVISTAPEPADWDTMEQAAGRELRNPSSPYWRHRDAFDAGLLSPYVYWARVLGVPELEDGHVDTMEALDAAQWSHLNPSTMEILGTLQGEGAQLALLSNMPEQMSVRYLNGSAWSGYFAKTYFSGRLRLAKPDPRIFAHVLADLPAAPRDVVFIDDNKANIAAAQAMGVRTVLFGPGTDLGRELADLRK